MDRTPAEKQVDDLCMYVNRVGECILRGLYYLDGFHSQGCIDKATQAFKLALKQLEDAKEEIFGLHHAEIAVVRDWRKVQRTEGR